MKLSIIVPTIGRPSLAATLGSLVGQPLDGDEVLVIGGPAAAVSPWAQDGVRHLPCRQGKHYGCEERTLGISQARGTHLAFIDDDDAWVPGARAAIGDAVAERPDSLLLFQMRYASGRVLWEKPKVRRGNVSTQMIVVPNDPVRLGRWTWRREGDYDFIRTCHWSPHDTVWVAQVIANIGAER
jgi:glycosyltransferase involved in cell wall biosynthesis